MRMCFRSTLQCISCTLVTAAVNLVELNQDETLMFGQEKKGFKCSPIVFLDIKGARFMDLHNQGGRQAPVGF